MYPAGASFAPTADPGPGIVNVKSLESGAGRPPSAAEAGLVPRLLHQAPLTLTLTLILALILALILTLALGRGSTPAQAPLTLQ